MVTTNDSGGAVVDQLRNRSAAVLEGGTTVRNLTRLSSTCLASIIE
jgi:hypothetical protein